MPNAVRASPRADDSDGLRPEHSRDALHTGCPGTTLACGKRLSSWLDVECEVHDPVLARAALPPETCRLKHLEHPPVVDQRVSGEPGDPVRGRITREVLQQERRKPSALLCIRYRKCDLSRVAALEPVVATNADHVIAEKNDKRHAVVIVDGREASDLLVGERGTRAEEAEVHALRRLVREERAMGRGVVGPDGTDMHRAAVREDGIHRPCRWIAGRKW